jgi:hypothetical protein
MPVVAPANERIGRALAGPHCVRRRVWCTTGFGLAVWGRGAVEVHPMKGWPAPKQMQPSPVRVESHVALGPSAPRLRPQASCAS